MLKEEDQEKIINNYEDYSIDKSGIIKNNKTGKIVPWQKVGRGYYMVHLKNEEGWKMFLVHRLVAQAFIPNPYNFPQVNHKDEDKSNNCVDNLEWCSAEYNSQYSKSKPIGQFKNGIFIKQWNSTWEPERAGIAMHQNIQSALNGKYKQCAGYEWRYI